MTEPSNIDNSHHLLTWPSNKVDYTIVRSIGQGATSIVYEASCLSLNNKKCAMKIINLEKCSNSTLLDEIKKEIRGMKNMKNENIVTYYASFVAGTELCILMDLCQKGSLLDIIKATQAKRDITTGVFDENTIATILRDVLKGLSYIHENGLVHRDLKCGNLLVKDDAVIQIADFGVAGFLAARPMEFTGMSLDDKRFTFVGTPCWMAPEVMQQVKGHNQKADIWSIGITAIEMATGQAPYAKYTPMKVLMLTLQNDPPDIDTTASSSSQYTNYGQKYRKFTKLCLQKDPSLRPAAKDLLQTPFIKSKCKDRDLLAKVLLSCEIPPAPAKKFKDDRLDKSAKGFSGEWNFDFKVTNDQDSSDEESLKKPEPSNTENVFYRITLRKRKPKQNNELQDISFNYVLGKDSVDILARELVEADLLDGCDLLLVAHNLSELVANPSSRERVFALNSPPSNGVVNESELNGYAKVLLRYAHEDLPALPEKK